MDTIFLDQSYPVSLDSLATIRSNIQKSSEAMKLGKNNTNDLQLAATEIFTNLIKYPSRIPTEIKIRMGNIGDEIILEILDNGSSFLEFENISNSILDLGPEVFEENTSTGGRGLMMLQMMFSRFEYFPHNDTEFNKYLLTKKSTNIEKNKKTHILLIDDNELDIALYTEFLSEEYHITAYTNPEEALLFAAEKNINLILCDINMPTMMGTEFYTQLNSTSDKGNVPFIFLSANKNSNVTDKVKDLAINDSITKPIDKDSLLDIVNRVLKRHKHEMSIAGTRLDADITDLISPNISKNIGLYSTHYRWKSSEAGGGDILFHFPASGNQKNSILVIGDLMGHGEQAKFFSVCILGYLRGLIRANTEKDLTPSKILEHLSDAMFHDEILEKTMLTCLIISIDQEGKGTIANAGHVPPVLIKEDTIKTLDVYGTLLGLSNDQEYNSIPFSLEHGQKAIFITDGFLEIDRKTREPEEFFEQYKHLNSKKMVEEIFENIEKKLEDDALIAILERK